MMMDGFNDFTRGGTAPPRKSSGLNKNIKLQQQEVLDDSNNSNGEKRLYFRPKTISGGGESELSEFNASLRHQKIMRTTRGENNSSHEPLNISIHEGRVNQNRDLEEEDEYIKAMESFQAAVDSWSVQKDIFSSSVVVTPCSPGLTSAVTSKRPESRNRVTKDPKKQTANALLSAYTQNVPNIVLHAQSHNQSSRKGTLGSSKLGGSNNGASLGNSNNASPRVQRDKDAKAVQNSNIFHINEIKAVYGNVDTNNSRNANPSSQLLPRSKQPSTKFALQNNANSSSLRSPSMRNSDLTALPSPTRRPSSLHSEPDVCQPPDPSQAVVPIRANNGTSDQLQLVEGYIPNSNISKRAKKAKSPSLLKSSLEPKNPQGQHLLVKFGSDGYRSSETLSDKAADESEGGRVSPFDVVLNQSPKGKGVKSREEIDEFSDVDVNCTSANENSTTDTIHEEEVNNGNNINIISARLSIGNINKKKDKSELKKESSSALKSPSLSKRGPLKRSESGLNFILEDNDEIGESLNNSDHSYDLKAGSISSYNSNANLLVQGVPDLSVRPQSRKLYLGIEGITKNYNTNAAINVAAVNVASTSGPLTLSLPAPGGIASSINTNSSGSFANSKAPRSAGTRYLSLSSPPGLDGGDGNAENNLEDTQNNCTDAISPEKPTLKKMYSFNQSIKPTPWQEEDLLPTRRPPSRQRSAFPVHLVEPQQVTNNASGNSSGESSSASLPVDGRIMNDTDGGGGSQNVTSSRAQLASMGSAEGDYNKGSNIAAGIVVATNAIKVSTEGLNIRGSISKRLLLEQKYHQQDEDASVSSHHSHSLGLLHSNRPPSRQKLAAQHLFEGLDTSVTGAVGNGCNDENNETDLSVTISSYDIVSDNNNNSNMMRPTRSEIELQSTALHSRSVPTTAVSAVEPSPQRHHPFHQRANTTRGVGLGGGGSSGLHYDPKDDGFSEMDLSSAPFFIQINNNSEGSDDFSVGLLDSYSKYNSYDKLVRSTTDLMIGGDSESQSMSSSMKSTRRGDDNSTGRKNSVNGNLMGKSPGKQPYSGGGGELSPKSSNAKKYSSVNYYYSATKNVNDKSRSTRGVNAAPNSNNSNNSSIGGGGNTQQGLLPSTQSFHCASTSNDFAVSSNSTGGGVTGSKDGWTDLHSVVNNRGKNGHLRAQQIFSAPSDSRPHHMKILTAQTQSYDSDVEDDEMTIMTEESSNAGIMEASMSLQSFALDSSLGEDFLNLFAPSGI